MKFPKSNHQNFIKIYEPHYCKNTGITYIDYEIKHDKIEDESAPRFVARRQDKLENIEDEKYIATFLPYIYI